MSRNDVNYEGVTVTDKYLTVSFTTGNSAAKRFQQVKVPVDHLVEACVAEVINSAVARNLRAYWEQGEVPLTGL